MSRLQSAFTLVDIIQINKSYLLNTAKSTIIIYYDSFIIINIVFLNSQ